MDQNFNRFLLFATDENTFGLFLAVWSDFSHIEAALNYMQDLKITFHHNKINNETVLGNSIIIHHSLKPGDNGERFIAKIRGTVLSGAYLNPFVNLHILKIVKERCSRIEGAKIFY
jgi:hypothetical protein